MAETFKSSHKIFEVSFGLNVKEKNIPSCNYLVPGTRLNIRTDENQGKKKLMQLAYIHDLAYQKSDRHEADIQMCLCVFTWVDRYHACQYEISIQPYTTHCQFPVYAAQYVCIHNRDHLIRYILQIHKVTRRSIHQNRIDNLVNRYSGKEV